MLVRRGKKSSDFFLKVMLLFHGSHGCHGAVYKHALPFPTLRVYLQGGECYRFTIERTLLCLEANALSTKPKERVKKNALRCTHIHTLSHISSGKKKKQSESALRGERERLPLSRKACSRGGNQLKWTFKWCDATTEWLYRGEALLCSERA